MTPGSPCDWAKPIEDELWAAIEALDEAKISIVKCLRGQNPPDENLRRFSEQFGVARGDLQKLLLDALCPDPEESDVR